MNESRRGEERGPPEALRTAIERTLSATAGSAAVTRERARELLDEVARRGQEAREEITRRGQEAREASTAITTRVVEAIQDMRLASREDVRKLSERLDSVERRLGALEKALRTQSPPEAEG